ncbi:hypothetical protein M9458_002808, partial [Cirrhinus mrigala]
PGEAVEAIRKVPDALAAAKKLCTLAQSAVVVQLNVAEDCCCCCCAAMHAPPQPPPSPGPGLYPASSAGVPPSEWDPQHPRTSPRSCCRTRTYTFIRRATRRSCSRTRASPAARSIWLLT